MATKTPAKTTEVKDAPVKMVRPDHFPAPHEADVHPAEVESFKAGGWTVAD